MRAIDADALIAQIEENICKPCIEQKQDYNRVRCRACQYGDEIDDIDSAPTISEHKKGKWKEEVDTGERMLACSACGGRVFLEPYETAVGEHGYRFCPYCGSYNGGENEV